MKRLIAPVMVAVVALASIGPVRADDRDRVTLSTTSAVIGQQVRLSIEVFTEPGASVDIDPVAPSWGSVEFVRIASRTTRTEAGGTRHLLELVIAPFMPGDVGFAPAVVVVQGSTVTPRTLPRVGIAVNQTLRPDQPDELSPLPGPRAIGGGESPLLRPAIGLAGAAAAALLYLIGFLAVRRWRTRPRPVPPVPAPAPPTAPDFAVLEATIHSDPATAYRTLATGVRSVLAGRYGIPAAALTASELSQRMEAKGLDRWQARLVSGLLDECDAVVYAGYRPATERRLFDLNMAREIVEAGP